MPLENRWKPLAINLLVVLALGGCTPNPDGSYGRPGSAMWMRSAQPEAVQDHLSRYSEGELCRLWVSRVFLTSGPDRKTLQAIADQWEERGRDRMTCAPIEAEERRTRQLRELRQAIDRNTEALQQQRQRGVTCIRIGDIITCD